MSSQPLLDLDLSKTEMAFIPSSKNGVRGYEFYNAFGQVSGSVEVQLGNDGIHAVTISRGLRDGTKETIASIVKTGADRAQASFFHIASISNPSVMGSHYVDLGEIPSGLFDVVGAKTKPERVLSLINFAKDVFAQTRTTQRFETATPAVAAASKNHSRLPIDAPSQGNSWVGRTSGSQPS